MAHVLNFVSHGRLVDIPGAKSLGRFEATGVEVKKTVVSRRAWGPALNHELRGMQLDSSLPM
eukprot:CAMPEP_0117506938 /NCGR_PEP_ID=MMETSP0784-20121206/26168_1 /TAXON_ID=39447 /ORGANISM="" /LENGTH=61 /DNA_ID=CAMNT_0005302431 /DNA_START=81 /DNA_END=266 /DNA_ORIENTATION=+